MLKKRIIAVLPIKNGIVVQSIGFNRYLPVGKPKIAVEYLNSWGADEIILVDLDASKEKRSILVELVREVSQFTQVPLAVGGGIQNIEQMKVLLAAGADKIIINTSAIENSKLISEGSEIFGNQCLVVSLDAKKTLSGEYEVYKSSGRIPTGKSVVTTAQETEKLGAGEIFVNSIEHDGSKKGYDLALAQLAAGSVDIPVIICGGVGSPRHFVEGLKVPNISAVAAGNFFHFQEHSVIAAKRYVLNSIPKTLRLDTYAQYKENPFDESGRLLKKNELELEKLFYEFHPKEVI
jgi:imidazole glycerol-phosphate synthase subunit HisF